MIVAASPQTIMTLWFVKVLIPENFTKGTRFAKTEALQRVLVGALVFSAFYSVYGCIAVVLGF